MYARGLRVMSDVFVSQLSAFCNMTPLKNSENNHRTTQPLPHPLAWPHRYIKFDDRQIKVLVCTSPRTIGSKTLLYEFHGRNLQKLQRLPSTQLQQQLQALSWLSRLFGGLSPQRPSINLRPLSARFAVDLVAQGLVFLRVLPFFPVRVIPPILRTHLCFTNAT